MPDMQFSRRSIPRQNNVFHNALPLHFFIRGTHTTDMKRPLLIFIAALFLSTMFFTLLGTHALEKRSSNPAITPQKTERRIPKMRLPKFYFAP